MAADTPARANARVAVVGGGWAGLSAAVTLAEAGRQVTLFEMAPQLGGRARRVDTDGQSFDNGQHILIGAYTETLALMGTVGVDLARALLSAKTLCFDNLQAAWNAVQACEDGLDFVAALRAELAEAAGCKTTATFDPRLARHGKARLLRAAA